MEGQNAIQKIKYKQLQSISRFSSYLLRVGRFQYNHGCSTPLREFHF